MESFVAQTDINKNRENTSRKLVVLKNLFCCAGRWGKWTFHQLPDDNRTKHVSAEAFEKKNRENIVFNLRKLMKLKKLARYARLGKLKDNSLAVELGG